MKMEGLLRYEVPPEIIALWKERQGEALLPVQELAVKRHGLFEGGNVLVQAPTSSGKTFVGEMAAVQTALRRKQVVYLVPLRALAEEKYRDFSGKYSEYGIRVIISSRDHREFDRDLESGNFSIAVVVYEKLSQLLVRRPERLHEIELIVADELELLSDVERGGMVEILLTRIVQSPCRLIGLSAVIGEAERLAEWMDAELVRYERRPVELRYGVLHEGVFRYRTYNEFSEAEEALVDAQSESAWESLTQNVCAFSERGESCLVFVKAKQEARRGAELLALRLEQPAATDAIEALQGLDATCARETLQTTLNSGVGFHSTDLAPEERRIVEEAFRRGEIRVMVSTSTLAVGLNMPARNVFITAEKWRYDQRFGMPWKAPIQRSEYENMGGRAGRYGAGYDFGRSILVASTPFDAETLWRRYVEGAREPVQPRLAKEPLENYVLRLVASRFCVTEEELLVFLEATLSGQWVWQEMYTLEEIEFRVRAAVNRAMDAGTLSREPAGKLEATPFGFAVASKGITIATARELEQWIGASQGRSWTELDLILAAAMTPDGRMYSVALTAQEYDGADYPGQLKKTAAGEELSADVPLNRFRNCNLVPFFEEVRAIKIALFLTEWIEHVPLRELEERYRTMTGQVLAAAEQVSWLIDAAAAIASARGCDSGFIERIRALSQRVQRGLRAEALPLAHLGEPGFSRSALAALVSHGLHSPQALVEISAGDLGRLVTRKEVERLKAWARRQVQGEEKKVEESAMIEELPVLVVDDRHPDRVLLEGAEVRLQEKQYRLIRLLAARPGECVPYEEIYEALWGAVIVENNQMHFQKRKLVESIRAVRPDHKDLIRTIPKRGFVLNLQPAEVDIRCAPSMSRPVSEEGVAEAARAG
ncbi:MAG: DEAD/DEAH box helicase [Candidatus Hydrogenedentes bacterium]|nr:DEAD/DEAH box helicase [Candidatus Hydrogenedentota bacterium]